MNISSGQLYSCLRLGGLSFT